MTRIDNNKTAAGAEKPVGTFDSCPDGLSHKTNCFLPFRKHHKNAHPRRRRKTKPNDKSPSIAGSGTVEMESTTA